MFCRSGHWNCAKQLWPCVDKRNTLTGCKVFLRQYSCVRQALISGTRACVPEGGSSVFLSTCRSKSPLPFRRQVAPGHFTPEDVLPRGNLLRRSLSSGLPLTACRACNHEFLDGPSLPISGMSTLNDRVHCSRKTQRF